MARRTRASTRSNRVEALEHRASRRKNIPTAELQSFVVPDEAAPRPMRYPRYPDLDPQLVWRGKDQQDADDLIVDTVPIYNQEKIQPKAIIDDIRRMSFKRRAAFCIGPEYGTVSYQLLRQATRC